MFLNVFVNVAVFFLMFVHVLVAVSMLGFVPMAKKCSWLCPCSCP